MDLQMEVKYFPSLEEAWNSTLFQAVTITICVKNTKHFAYLSWNKHAVYIIFPSVCVKEIYDKRQGWWGTSSVTAAS